MNITYLGQAGLLFETQTGNIMIDPYLSDSVAKINPLNYRRVPVDPRFFEIRPDVLIFTHDHLDHFDPETVEILLKKHTGITVLAPSSVWGKVRQMAPGNNYVLFDRFTRWTQNGIRFEAVKAQHSDACAIGVILTLEGKKYYITGDTLYSTQVLADLPQDLDVVFLPVNGVGNNMNMCDGADFFRSTGAKVAVPVHTGLFDELSGADFPVENKVVPEIYKEIKL